MLSCNQLLCFPGLAKQPCAKAARHRRSVAGDVAGDDGNQNLWCAPSHSTVFSLRPGAAVSRLYVRSASAPACATPYTPRRRCCTVPSNKAAQQLARKHCRLGEPVLLPPPPPLQPATMRWPRARGPPAAAPSWPAPRSRRRGCSCYAVLAAIEGWLTGYRFEHLALGVQVRVHATLGLLPWLAQHLKHGTRTGGGAVDCALLVRANAFQLE